MTTKDLLYLALLLTGLSAQAASSFTAITGNWNSGGNWSPGGVPNSSGVDVVIGTNAAAQTATLSTSVSARSLNINSSDRLQLLNGTIALAGNSGMVTLTNNGMIDLIPNPLPFDATTRSMTIASGSFLLSGNGTTNTTSGWLYQATGTFENAGNTIAGYGAVANCENTGSVTDPNGVRLINRGTILANVSGKYLNVYSRLGQWYNFGTLAASGGGRLYASSGYDLLINVTPSQYRVHNTGTLSAGTNSVIYAGFVSGGTLLTSGNGTIALNGIGDCANWGVVQLNRAASLQGAIVNRGTISTSDGSLNNPQFFGATNTVLSGGGTVIIGSTASLYVPTTSARFVNVNNTLVLGTCSIDFNTKLLNQGTLMLRDGSSTLTVNLGSTGEFVNTGTIHIPAGTLSLVNVGTLDSSSGTIVIGAQGRLRQDGYWPMVSVGRLVMNGLHIGGSPGFTVDHVTGSGTFAGSIEKIKQFDVATLGDQNGRFYVRGDNPINLPSRVRNLLPNARLSLHSLVVDYTGASQATTVRSMLANLRIVRPSDAPVIPGITLGYTEAINVGTTSFGEFALEDAALLVQTVYNGDANTDGTVNSVDFNTFVNAFGASNAFWWEGDFNYDAKVNTLDFNLLAGSFGKTLSAPALGTLIPEPSGLTALLAAGLLGFRRAR